MHLTTLTHWGFACDSTLVYLYFRASTEWEPGLRLIYFGLLMSWMFTSKFIKLMGHYIRYPGDFLLLPVSICFGYFHSIIIKVYALLSLNIVSVPPARSYQTESHSWEIIGSCLIYPADDHTVVPYEIVPHAPALTFCTDSMGQSRWGRRR